MEQETKTIATKKPADTVTFLFSDIEGSTQLLHRLGEQYAQALEEQKTSPLSRKIAPRRTGESHMLLS